MALTDSPTPLYSRANDVIGADVNGEVVLFSQESWSYVELDEIGRSIWSLLETPRSLPALVEALVAEFDVDQARCLHDARAFLDTLIEQGLVAVVEG